MEVEIENLRKNQFVLMSPQRVEEKLIKVYEILPEGIEVIDKTETDGFENTKFGEVKPAYGSNIFIAVMTLIQ